ncbi:MAG: hypothetical protein D6816_18635 [Bacteroidetes bacterium]|nr:MAG: hypothetical protein D6816_18635 [Bacteroidota bacterium]
MILGNEIDLTQHPRAVRVLKKDIPVRVDFAERSGVCRTKEGEVSYRVGDAILTGVEGEQWPIRRAEFDATYEAIPPTVHGEKGQYRKKPIEVLALQMKEPFYVVVSWSGERLEGKPGDWLLQYGPGDYGIVSKSIFEKTYQFIE